MNKIFEENHICSYCQCSEPPIDLRDEYPYCPQCGLPQLPEVFYEPDAPKIKALDCEHCGKNGEPLFQVRANTQKYGFPMTLITWECRFCRQFNYLRDALEILNAEIIEA